MAELPLLAVRQLSVTIAGQRLVDELSFDLYAGEVLGLVGQSGAGKSLSGRALMGLLPNHARVGGVARLEGKDLLTARRSEACRRRGRDIAMVFQDPQQALDPLMKVGQQIVEGPRLRGRLSRKQASQRCLDLLERVGLPPSIAACYPHQLSGGMQQRAMIAVALAGEPSVLIADEPTTALDAALELQILDLLLGLCAQLALAVLLITHDLRVVAGRCPRSIVLHRGRLVEQGTTSKLMSAAEHPATRALLGAATEPAS